MIFEFCVSRTVDPPYNALFARNVLYLTDEALSSLKELKYRRLCNKEQSHGWKDLKNGLTKIKNNANSDLTTTEKTSDGTLKHDIGRILTSDDY